MGIFDLTEFNCEVTNVSVKVQQHLRIRAIIFGNNLGLILHRLSCGIESILSLTHYTSLVIIDVFYALNVVFTRRSNHLNALSHFK